MIYKRSSALFAEAQKVIPGGVNSPVRAFASVGGTPIFIERAEGAYLYDVDGRKLIDYISSWGPLIFGHAYPPIIKAICEKAKLGTSFGAPTEIETDLASLVISMVPNVDKVRFVSSGTEACMSAIRLARGATAREKIIKFEGCYHGHADAFLIQAGSGALTLGSPNSLGVTRASAQDTLVATYNNLDSVKALFEANKGEISAIIVEPVAGNMGCIPPKDGFLEGLRKLCDAYGALLIFDEVMTGFRLAKGGAQERLKVKADIVTFGKIIGGGLPVGAFAAKSEIMNYLAPEGKVYQAGTLSGNPLAMASGLEMLRSIQANTDLYKDLEEKTNYLKEGLSSVFSKKKIDCCINAIGSMISVHFTDTPVFDFQSAVRGNNEKFKIFFHSMLEEGIYLPPSAFESYFLNNALSYDDLEQTVLRAEKASKRLH